MKLINSDKEYFKHFDIGIYQCNKKDEENDRKIARRLYLKAHDIRKFEIELYWKRATYFWGFIIALFGGLFAVQNMPDKWISSEISVIICAVGIFFSSCWYLANRGSKFWQENWERHVDVLEDYLHEPLYKTCRADNNIMTNFLGAYPFSVSRVNISLSLFTIFLWMAMFGKFFYLAYIVQNGNIVTEVLVSVLSFAFTFVVFFACHTKFEEKELAVKFLVRGSGT